MFRLRAAFLFRRAQDAEQVLRRERNLPRWLATTLALRPALLLARFNSLQQLFKPLCHTTTIVYDEFGFANSRHSLPEIDKYEGRIRDGPGVNPHKQREVRSYDDTIPLARCFVTRSKHIPVPRHASILRSHRLVANVHRRDARPWFERRRLDSTLGKLCDHVLL